MKLHFYLKITLLSLFLSTILSAKGQNQQHFSLNSTGLILKNGEPFYINGLYVGRGSIDSYYQAVDHIAQIEGVNVIHLPYLGNISEWRQFLDYCEERNIWVVSQLFYDGDYLDQVRAFKNHPAILAWSVADDGDNGHFSLQELKDRQQAVASLAPNKLTEMSLTGYYAHRQQAVDQYTPIADFSAYQCYPVDPLPDYAIDPDNRFLNAFQYMQVYANSAKKFNRSMMLNTQLFPWEVQGEPLHRFPSAQEISVMTYSGLLAGMNGFIGYNFTDLVNNQSAFNEYKQLNKELQQLKATCFHQQATLLATGDQKVIAGYWNNGTSDYLIIINTDESQSRTVNISANAYQQITKLFNRYSSSISLNDGKLSGTLSPLQVEIYKVDRSADPLQDGFYFIRNRHDLNLYLSYTEGKLTYTNQPDEAMLWQLTGVGNHYLISTSMDEPLKIHLENDQPYAEVGNVPDHYWTAHWDLVGDGAGFYEIYNRSYANKKLNIDSLKSYVQSDTGNSGWWTGQWHFELESINLRLTNTSALVPLTISQKDDHITVHIQNEQPTNCQLIDSQGRLVFEASFLQHLQIDQPISAGVYLFFFKCGDKEFFKKLWLNQQ